MVIISVILLEDMAINVSTERFLTVIGRQNPPFPCPFHNCYMINTNYMGLRHHVLKNHYDESSHLDENEYKHMKDSINAKMIRPLSAGKKTRQRRSKLKKWNIHKTHPSRKIRPTEVKQSNQSIIKLKEHKFMSLLSDQTVMTIGINNSIKIVINGKDNQFTPFKPSESVISKVENSQTDGLYLPFPSESQNVNIINKKNSVAIPLPNIPSPKYVLIDNFSDHSSREENSKDYYILNEALLNKTVTEIEYDMDEEDYAWLDIINKQSDVNFSDKVFEFLIDKIEKKAFILQHEDKVDIATTLPIFHKILSANRKFSNLKSNQSFKKSGNKHEIMPNSNTSHSSIDDSDEDAVCCICNDGECSNSNVILFCDACNIAVHQECYGVPYIPEGQWLCRVCLQEPSTTPAYVDCVLCPNRGGAYKRVHDISNTNFKAPNFESFSDDIPNYILNPSSICLWSHVVCALWIPEVSFGNTVFLEPVDNVERIPAARWKLTCYVCRQKGVGACIQCHKTNCYTAFHVTCGQQAGLYMALETGTADSRFSAHHNAQSPPLSPSAIKKIAYCDTHVPANLTADDWSKSWSVKLANPANGASFNVGKAGFVSPSKYSPNSLDMIKKARKLLAEKRSKKPPPPVVVLPELSRETIDAMCRTKWPTLLPSDRDATSGRDGVTKDSVKPEPDMYQRDNFIKRLLAYWKLKRQARNGFPLIKRLQVQMHGPNLSATLKELIDFEKERDKDIAALPKRSKNVPCSRKIALPPAKNRLLSATQSDSRLSSRSPTPAHLSPDLHKPWLKLRQDLEKARLLIELIQKREKLKKEQLKLHQTAAEYRLIPLTMFLRPLLTHLEGLDTQKIFREPVDTKEVHDYLSFVPTPMDFSTMGKRLEGNVYSSFQDFLTDFNLIISNCKAYNPEDSIFYKAATALQEKTSTLLKNAGEVVGTFTAHLATQNSRGLDHWSDTCRGRTNVSTALSSSTRITDNKSTGPTLPSTTPTSKKDGGSTVEKKRTLRKRVAPSHDEQTSPLQIVLDLESDISDLRAELGKPRRDSVSREDHLLHTRSLRMKLRSKQFNLRQERRYLSPERHASNLSRSGTPERSQIRIPNAHSSPLTKNQSSGEEDWCLSHKLSSMRSDTNAWTGPINVSFPLAYLSPKNSVIGLEGDPLGSRDDMPLLPRPPPPLTESTPLLVRIGNGQGDDGRSTLPRSGIGNGNGVHFSKNQNFQPALISSPSLPADYDYSSRHHHPEKSYKPSSSRRIRPSNRTTTHQDISTSHPEKHPSKLDNILNSITDFENVRMKVSVLAATSHPDSFSAYDPTFLTPLSGAINCHTTKSPTEPNVSIGPSDGGKISTNGDIVTTKHLSNSLSKIQERERDGAHGVFFLSTETRNVPRTAPEVTPIGETVKDLNGFFLSTRMGNVPATAPKVSTMVDNRICCRTPLLSNAENHDASMAICKSECIRSREQYNGGNSMGMTSFRRPGTALFPPSADVFVGTTTLPPSLNSRESFQLYRSDTCLPIPDEEEALFESPSNLVSTNHKPAVDYQQTYIPSIDSPMAISSVSTISSQDLTDVEVHHNDGADSLSSSYDDEEDRPLSIMVPTIPKQVLDRGTKTMRKENGFR